MQKICLIDYKQGNLGSVFHGFSRLGQDVEIATAPKGVPSDSILILPGVGSFDSGAKRLEENGWVDFLKEWSHDGKALVGICLGMQLMARSSGEGVLDGLGIFEGQCQPNPSAPASGIRVPNVGWRQVTGAVGSVGSSLVPPQSRFYFSHSYHYEPLSNADTIASVDYGEKFPAVILKKRTMGIQFHPEKSQQYGMHFLHNALKLLEN